MLVWELSKVLATLLAEQGSYSFIDKLGYAPTRDLAALYLKEALRDLHSLISSEKPLNKNVKTIIKGIDWNQVKKELDDVASSKSRRELREKVSLITGEALALSAKLLESTSAASSQVEGGS